MIVVIRTSINYQSQSSYKVWIWSQWGDIIRLPYEINGDKIKNYLRHGWVTSLEIIVECILSYMAKVSDRTIYRDWTNQPYLNHFTMLWEGRISWSQPSNSLGSRQIVLITLTYNMLNYINIHCEIKEKLEFTHWKVQKTNWK